MKHILGINAGEINSSAVLLTNGQIKFGAPEERFIRQKLTKQFPRNAISFCLTSEGINLSDVGAIAQGWNAGAHLQSFNPLISSNRTHREFNLYTVADNLLNFTDRATGDFVKVEFSEAFHLPPIYHVQHHRCHAANAFYLSNYDDAAILTADFRGENECTTWGFGRGNKINTLQTQQIPDSLGMFYATYTSLLGYKPDSDEWKVMAMSAYPGNCTDYVNKIKQTYGLLPNGELLLDQRFYTGIQFHLPKIHSPELVKLLGIPEGARSDNPTEEEMKIAKAMQICAEEIAVHFLDHLYSLTKLDKVVLAGGFFMNSVFNGKILDKTKFRQCYIPYAPSDAGNAIGAALFLYHDILGNKRQRVNNSALIGPSYSDVEIESSLIRRGLKFEKVADAPKVAAEEINKGHVVAVYWGSMEFGDRALGCRSIIADPRRAEMKDKINRLVKYREAYRPFAPAILEERVDEFFEVGRGFSCRYMEKVVQIKEEFRIMLPAITHIDGSGRVQTVNREENPVFYKLIEEFWKLSGIPIVVNTSLNVNGEPLVNSPDDALSTFFNSGLEVLVLGSFVVRK